jgi:hypothetical protein
LADHALCKMVRYVLLRPLRPEIGRQLFKYLWLPSKLSRLLDSRVSIFLELFFFEKFDKNSQFFEKITALV